MDLSSISSITFQFISFELKYVRSAFYRFPDFFFVQVSKIVTDSCKFSMLLLYILWDDGAMFMTLSLNIQLQQELEYTLLKPDCHSWWISKMQSGRGDTLEERYAITFCFRFGKSDTETYGRLQTTFGASCMNRASVFELHKRFIWIYFAYRYHTSPFFFNSFQRLISNFLSWLNSTEFSNSPIFFICSRNISLTWRHLTKSLHDLFYLLSIKLITLHDFNFVYVSFPVWRPYYTKWWLSFPSVCVASVPSTIQLKDPITVNSSPH